MTRYIFLFFVLLWTGVVRGEEIPAGFKATDANLFGHVVDKKTGEHLPYFTVFLKGTTIGSVTEASGHYFLKNLPEGSFVLVAKSVGYKTVERQVTLKRGVTQEVNFEVEEDLVALDEVVVSANRSETTRRMAPTLVKVLDDKLFELKGASCLAEGVSF